MSRFRSFEALVWILIAGIAAIAMLTWAPAPLSYDGFQYLNAAENFSAGRGISTSLVQYDTERSHGRIPAPLTTFPPGYPIAISVASPLASAERAARWISVVSHAGTAGLLSWGLLVAGVRFFFRLWILALFAANIVSLRFATAVATESLFTFLTLGAVVMWIAAETRSRSAGAGFVAISCALGGFAYLTRYAGVFLLAPLTGYALYRWYVRKDGPRFLLCAAIPGLIAGCAMLRNVLLVGNWRGGNDMDVHNAAMGVFVGYFRAQLHVLSGSHAIVAGVWEAAAALGIAGLGVQILKSGGRRATPGAGVVPVTMCIAIYSAGLCYAGLRTVISFDTRMFVPMLPLYLLLLGLLLNRWIATPDHWTMALLALTLVGYLGVNGRDLYEPLQESRLDVMARLFARPGSDGRPLRQWVEENIGPNDGILAADGQATGYFLRRPTLSMVSEHYSRIRWECDEVQRQFQRFRLRYAVLYKPAPPGSPDEGNSFTGRSSFLDRAAAGPPGCGFAIAAENARVRILKRTDSE